MSLYISIILLLPLLSFTFFSISRKKTWNRNGWIFSITILLALACSLGIFIMILLLKEPGYIFEKSWIWINNGNLVFDIGFTMNNISILMLIITCIIAGLVHLYSMESLESNTRYYKYVSLTTFLIFGIILSNNLLVFLILWTFTSYCSFFLTTENLDYQNYSRDLKQYFTLFIGDLFLLIAVMIIFYATGTFNFHNIFQLIKSGAVSVEMRTVAGLLITLSVMSKAAQIPFNTWLVSASDSRTSADAYIQTTGMLSMGIFLLLKIYPLLTEMNLLLLSYLGSIISLTHLIIASLQTNIKRFLLFSAGAHAGIIIFGVGVNAYPFVFYYLIAFMLFNTFIFLNIDSITRSLHHSGNYPDLDIRNVEFKNLNGLYKRFPFQYYTFLAMALVISGLPLTITFISRNSILASAISSLQIHPGYWIPLGIGFLISIFLSFSIFRVFFHIFHGEQKIEINTKEIIHPKARLYIPLSVLLIFEFYIFYALPGFNPISYKCGLNSMLHPFYTEFSIASQFQDKFLLSALISTLFSLSGILLAWLFYTKKIKVNETLKNKYPNSFKLIKSGFNLEKITSLYIIIPLTKISNILSFFDNVSINKGLKYIAGKTTDLISTFTKINNRLIKKAESKLRIIYDFFNKEIYKLNEGNFKTIIIILAIIITLFIILALI